MDNSIENIAIKHYENFPVGSIFLNKNLRKPIHEIYTFARVADDIADSAIGGTQQKILKLTEWENSLKIAIESKSENEFFTKLANTILNFNLSTNLLFDLITAFKMDANGIRFLNYDEVLFYCKHSANPIGRLLLELSDNKSDENYLYSDKICSALQIINFVQDYEIDFINKRCYLPEHLMKKNNLEEKDILINGKPTLIEYLNYAIKLLDEGKPLLKNSNKNLRFEISLIWNSGKVISEKIRKNLNLENYKRPEINIFDKITILSKSIISK